MNLIKNFIVLIIKIVAISYVIAKIHQWWHIHFGDFKEYKYITPGDMAEEYYKENGIQCDNCECWLPHHTLICPICDYDWLLPVEEWRKFNAS